MIYTTEINVFFKRWAILGLFFIYFRLFKQTLQFLQQIIAKNFHPVYGCGIRMHDLWYMSLLLITTRPGLPPQLKLMLECAKGPNN